MSKRSQEKRKARSKEKKLARRRMMGISPLSRLAGTAEEACECWMNYDRDDDRTRNLLAIRPLRGGGHIAAFFLIDLDCLGLKDAYWRADIDASKLREMMRQRSLENGTCFVNTTVEEMRCMVAAAMRWMLAHPFRLPEDALDTVKILGDPLDVENASVADFGAEDGLFYVGYEEDLEKALKGVTLDEFLDREDVDYEFMDDEPEDFDDEENAFDGGGVTEEERASTFELAEGMVRICVAEVKRWCAEKGVRPAAELERAAKLHVASVLSVVASVGMGATEQEAKEGSHGLLQNLIRDQGGDVAPAIVAALAQIRACAATHPDHLINGALDRFDRSSPDTIDVPLEHALPTEPPCSTPATPSSPLSSSNTPVP